MLIPTNTCPQIGNSSTTQYIFFPQTNCRPGKSKATATKLCSHLSGSASGLVMTDARTTPSVTTTAQPARTMCVIVMLIPKNTCPQIGDSSTTQYIFFPQTNCRPGKSKATATKLCSHLSGSASGLVMTVARTTPSATTTAQPARTMCVIVMLIPTNTCPQIGDSSTTQYIFFPQTNCRPGKSKATATKLCSHLSGSASGLVMTDARTTPSATTTAQPARTMCVIVMLIPKNTCPQIGDSSTTQYIFFPQTNCRPGKSKATATKLCSHLSGSASGLVMTVARTTPSVTTTAQPARTMCVIVMLIPTNTCPQIGDSSTTQYIFFPQTNCRPGKSKATATKLCSHLSGSASGLVTTAARTTPSATTTAQPARTMCVIVILIPTNTCPQIGDSSTIQYIFFPQTNCRSGKSKAISTYLCCHLSGSASGLVMTVARTTPSVTTTAQGQSPTSRSNLAAMPHDGGSRCIGVRVLLQDKSTISARTAS